MSDKTVVFFRERGKVPVLDWIDGLKDSVAGKAVARIRMLADCGEGLRRPIAAPLRDGIHELRWQQQRVQYRILYAFHGTTIAVLLAGTTKKQKTPQIDLAVKRFEQFKHNPEAHTFKE
jgi:hypothetical protein